METASEVKAILQREFGWPADATVQADDQDHHPRRYYGTNRGCKYYIGLYPESQKEHIVGNHATKHGMQLVARLKQEVPEAPFAGTLLFEESAVRMVKWGGEDLVCVVAVNAIPIHTLAELRSKAPPNFLELVENTMAVVHAAGYLWSTPISPRGTFVTIDDKLHMCLPDARARTEHAERYIDRRIARAVPQVKQLCQMDGAGGCDGTLYAAMDVRRDLYETRKTNLESFFYLALHMYAPPSAHLPWADLPPNAGLLKASTYHPTVEGKAVEHPEFYVDGLLTVMQTPDDARPAIRAIGLRAFALAHSDS